MPDAFAFRVDIEPVGKARPRVCMRGGHARAYTPAKTADYERTIAQPAKIAMLAAGFSLVEKPAAVRVTIRAAFSVPQSWTKKKRAAALSGAYPHITKPDADNLGKAILDALNGIIYADDSQVTDCHVIKGYADTPGVDILISTAG